MTTTHIPCGSITFVIIPATATFKINFLHLLCNTNITFKLSQLDRNTITLYVTNTHKHKLDVFGFLNNLGHNVAQLLSTTSRCSAHRASYIKTNNNRQTIRMLLRIASFAHYIHRRKSLIKPFLLINVIHRSTIKCIHAARFSSRTICSITPRGPRTSTHKYTSFFN